MACAGKKDRGEACGIAPPLGWQWCLEHLLSSPVVPLEERVEALIQVVDGTVKGATDRVFCGVDANHTGHLVSLVAGTLGIQDHVDSGNVAVAMVHAIGPRDPVESLLACQMVAANDVAMEMLRRARIPEQPSEIVDDCVLRATRLMRTFTAQVAALKDYRSKGHQTVTVQHVDVRDGGQAIVGKDVVLNKGGEPGGGGS
jgi:hypothetical protein